MTDQPETPAPAERLRVMRESLFDPAQAGQRVQRGSYGVLRDEFELTYPTIEKFLEALVHIGACAQGHRFTVHADRRTIACSASG